MFDFETIESEEVDLVEEIPATEQERQAWLAERRTGIGGSDASVILGLNPWKSAYELWLDKSGLVVNDFDNERMHFGRIMEDVVAKEYMTRTGKKVRRYNRMVRSDEHPFMLANIDRMVVGEKRLLEIKTTGQSAFYGSDWGPDGSDQIPVYYNCQVQHYMTVFGYPVCDVALLVGGNMYRQYEIHHDPEFCAKMIEAQAEFWERVETGNAPPLDYSHPTAIDLLKRINKNVIAEKIIDLDNDAFDIHCRRNDLKAQIKELEKEEKILEAKLRDIVGEASAARFPDGSGYRRKIVAASDVSYTRKEYVDFRFSKKA